MLRDVPRRLRSAVPIVDPDERAASALPPAQRARLDLASVFQNIIRLRHRHGKLPDGVAAEILVPEEAVVAADRSTIPDLRLPAGDHDPHQRDHASLLLHVHYHQQGHDD